MFFDSCLDSSQLIENCVLKSNRNKITVLQCFTIFFFDSSLNPFSHKLLLFFWSFYESKFQGFSSLTPSKSLLPFFLLNYMHTCIFIKFFQIFELKKFWVFDDFECFDLVCWMGFCSCIILTWSLGFNFFFFKS